MDDSNSEGMKELELIHFFYGAAVLNPSTTHFLVLVSVDNVFRV